MDELVEERPVAGALVRHRGARMEQHGVERSAPRLEIHAGAVWIRATEAGPGVLATHGAATVQVREGAAVLEVSDFEALLVVVSGRVAVKGAAALPRSVTAGHAVTLNLDGGFGTPEPLTAEELHADRFVVENLARDVLVEAEAAPLDSAPEPEAAPPPAPLAAPVGARVDGTPPEAPAPESMPLDPDLGSEAPAEDEPVVVAAAPVAAYDPAPLAVPSLGADEPAAATDAPDASRPPRRGLVAVVIVLVILAAVVGAIVLTGDDVRSVPPADDLTSEAASTEPVATPEATLQGCAATPAGYEARGVVSGGNDGVARYQVEVGLEDTEGTVYAEKAATVAARTDPTVAVRWTVELALAPAEVRPDSECRIVEVKALP